MVDEETHIKQLSTTRQIKDIQRQCTTAESFKQSLEDQRTFICNTSCSNLLVKSQRALVQDRDEQLQTSHTEKMETFKQFRSLNRLYEDLKESSEAIEMKRNHLIHHSKELEVRCGVYVKDEKVMAEKLRVASDELGVARRAYDESRLEKTKLVIEGNNYQVEKERRWLETG